MCCTEIPQKLSARQLILSIFLVYSGVQKIRLNLNLHYKPLKGKNIKTDPRTWAICPKIKGRFIIQKGTDRFRKNSEKAKWRTGQRFRRKKSFNSRKRSRRAKNVGQNRNIKRDCRKSQRKEQVKYGPPPEGLTWT